MLIRVESVSLGGPVCTPFVGRWAFSVRPRIPHYSYTHRFSCLRVPKKKITVSFHFIPSDCTIMFFFFFFFFHFSFLCTTCDTPLTPALQKLLSSAANTLSSPVPTNLQYSALPLDPFLPLLPFFLLGSSLSRPLLSTSLVAAC